MPIPDILDWSVESPYVIGSKYLILEHASGNGLRARWPSMSIREKLCCIVDNVNNTEQMAVLGHGLLHAASHDDSNIIRSIAVAKLLIASISITGLSSFDDAKSSPINRP